MANKIVARLNWGAFNHASHVPQLRYCNYYLYYAQVLKIGDNHNENVIKLGHALKW